ncbi:hypothetical protein BAUCODRAFT_559204 [Baudoinia panamericana UAMH 10762]|uniref:Uncharacterized protein n=1 Tax=Baudoinia panamericana (strain UAMH 10762) TaxID=717646 RepID=M2LKG1_BAUPA|nr:uncharacterized protein BAUCODRAFT_559204 [Baudoinia panamericana UAMH 10762]EMC94762.1 hypothetical protein BAUCODRAFT_559204 [Baudoinia panamericana UAMH 10762]
MILHAYLIVKRIAIIVDVPPSQHCRRTRRAVSSLWALQRYRPRPSFTHGKQASQHGSSGMVGGNDGGLGSGVMRARRAKGRCDTKEQCDSCAIPTASRRALGATSNVVQDG